MPYIDSQLFNNKAEKKKLTIQFTEDENILAAIKQAMQENHIREGTITGINGKIKEGKINYFERSQYKTAKLKDTQMILASGSLKLSYNELWGSLHVSTGGKKPITGTLQKGTASPGLEIEMAFIEEKQPQASP